MTTPRRHPIKALLSPLCAAVVLLSAVSIAPERADARVDERALRGAGAASTDLPTRRAERDREAAATGAVAVRGAYDGGRERRKVFSERAPIGMTEGGGVQAPHGYQALCARDARFCEAPTQPRPGVAVPADQALLERLAAYNRSVNAAYTPAEDLATHGVSDLWTLPVDRADCEDYALAKQAGLIAAGWPRESVLIGVVIGETSPFHAVLIVRTSKGEFVMDNLTDEMVDWRDSGYRWVIRQSAERPQRWVRVLDETPAEIRDVADLQTR